uniref:Tc1-like transposase DDE domain-containing protein n=1 Tax=Trichogramma kaykai TaxID=54128 RepID=A0ABD2WBB0_9HYME
MCFLIPQCYLLTGRQGVWRLIGTRYEPQNVIQTVHSGRVNRSYWASCSGDGPLAICEIARKMRGPDYRVILNDVLYPAAIQRYPQRELIYVIEDNSGVHRSRIVREWYANHPRLVRLPHSSRSPELNFLENMWSKMTARHIPGGIQNLEGLREKVIASWNELFEKSLKREDTTFIINILVKIISI